MKKKEAIAIGKALSVCRPVRGSQKRRGPKWEAWARTRFEIVTALRAVSEDFSRHYSTDFYEASEL